MQRLLVSLLKNGTSVYKWLKLYGFYSSPDLWKLIVQIIVVVINLHYTNIIFEYQHANFYLSVLLWNFIFTCNTFALILTKFCGFLILHISHYTFTWWEVKLIKWFLETVPLYLQPVNDLDFHPQGTILVSGAKDQTIK
jgi:hypothetical protein